MLALDSPSDKAPAALENAMLKIVALGVVLAASSAFLAPAATGAAAPAHAATCRVDDPPPAECPFCGGNPELHRVRMQHLETICSRLALSVTRVF